MTPANTCTGHTVVIPLRDNNSTMHGVRSVANTQYSPHRFGGGDWQGDPINSTQSHAIDRVTLSLCFPPSLWCTVCVLHLDFHVGLGYEIERVTGN